MAKKPTALSDALMPVEEQAAIPPRENSASDGNRGRGRPKNETVMTIINLRLPADIINEIDEDRGDLYSRNAWISQAIADKLKKIRV